MPMLIQQLRRQLLVLVLAWAPALVLACAPALVLAGIYGPSLAGARWVHDDIAAVVDNPLVAWPPDLAGIAAGRWFGPVAKFDVFPARPLATLSYCLEIPLGLATPWGRRLVNLALGWGCAWLLALLVHQWRRALLPAPQAVTVADQAAATAPKPTDPAVWVAALAAALFCAHPALVEVLFCAANRPELMSLLFCLLAVRHAIAWVVRGHRAGPWLVGLWWGCALLSKESAVALAGVVLVWWLADRERRSQVSRLLAVLAVIFALFSGWRMWNLGGKVQIFVHWHDNPLQRATLPDRLLTALDVTGRAVQHLLWPVDLAPDYTFDAWPLRTALSAAAVTGAGALALLVAIGVALLRQCVEADLSTAIHRFGRISALLRRFSQSRYASTAQSFSSLRLVERQRATEHWHPKSAAAEDFRGEFGSTRRHQLALLLLLAAGLGWYLPVSNLLIASTVLFADRLLCVPVAAAAMATAVVIGKFATVPRAWLSSALVIVVAACSWQSFTYAQAWQTPLTLFSRGVQLQPRSMRMQANLAHTIVAERVLLDPVPPAHAALALDSTDAGVLAIGLDAAAYVHACPAAEPFVRALERLRKPATKARLAAIEWGGRCKQFGRAFAVGTAITPKALGPGKVLDLYVLAVAANLNTDAANWAQFNRIDPAIDPQWRSAAAQGALLGDRPLQAADLLVGLHGQLGDEPQLRDQAAAVLQAARGHRDHALVTRRLLAAWPALGH